MPDTTPPETEHDRFHEQFVELIIRREIEYANYSLDEKRVYWQGYFVENLFRGTGTAPFDVAAFRQYEPDFDLFLGDIADALSDETGEDREEILKHAFINFDNG